jgi:hypothetical protein
VAAAKGLEILENVDDGTVSRGAHAQNQRPGGVGDRRRFGTPSRPGSRAASDPGAGAGGGRPGTCPDLSRRAGASTGMAEASRSD